MLVFSVTDEISFQHLDFWLGEVREYAGTDVPCLLVGNKSDSEEIERKVTPMVAISYASKSRCIFSSFFEKLPDSFFSFFLARERISTVARQTVRN